MEEPKFVILMKTLLERFGVSRNEIVVPNCVGFSGYKLFSGSSETWIANFRHEVSLKDNKMGITIYDMRKNLRILENIKDKYKYENGIRFLRSLPEVKDARLYDLFDTEKGILRITIEIDPYPEDEEVKEKLYTVRKKLNTITNDNMMIDMYIDENDKIHFLQYITDLSKQTSNEEGLFETLKTLDISVERKGKILLFRKCFLKEYVSK